ncbi:DUF6545 domain-containing protein [Streptomyces sp. T028]|uniref:DUF6545 domain-containing protein n=1 Tax=Streptomyces sp. T028 TaxID=3394379 RepID=UPI003A8A756D
MPEIALNPDAARRRPGLRGAEFALYRRVIGIRDGSLALRPYQEPESLSWATERLNGSAPMPSTARPSWRPRSSPPRWRTVGPVGRTVAPGNRVFRHPPPGWRPSRSRLPGRRA